MNQKKYSILIIDDNSDDRYLLKRKLNKTNIVSHIFEAINGQTAIDLLTDYQANKIKFPQEFPPVILFLDVNMPLLNGFEFLEAFSKIRSINEGLKSSVIMMFTSSGDPQDKERAFSYDFVKAYITKDNASHELIADKILEVVNSNE